MTRCQEIAIKAIENDEAVIYGFELLPKDVSLVPWCREKYKIISCYLHTYEPVKVKAGTITAGWLEGNRIR